MENNISILNFAAQKVPDFKEERGKDWVMFGTEGEYKNRYPEYLLDLYRRSAKHNAIINAKKDYVVGKGWAVDNKALNTERTAELEQFLKRPNAYEDMNAILEKVALDMELYNGFALEIVYNQLNDKIAAVYHADFARYRSNEDGSCYYYSEDWSKFRPEVEKIEAFDWKNPCGKQLLYVKVYHPDCKYYPLPTYLGSTAYIELDVEIANFHLNSIKNGFMGGTLINFYNGEPTAEEQEAIERQIKDKFTNTDNANSIVLNFSDSKERGAEIQQLNGNDFDKRFEILNNTVQKEIYAGHQVVDPALFGIKEDGIFTSRAQLVDSFELFQNTYVNNRQQIIERVFNQLAALQGFENRLYIQDTEPISVQFSETTVVSVMTQNEIREKMGLAPLEEPTEVAACKHGFNSDVEQSILKHFRETGSSDYEFVTKHRKGVDFTGVTNKQKREDFLRKYWFADIDPIDTAILAILEEEPSTPFLDIAQALEIDTERLMSGVQSLSSLGAITILIENVEDATQRVVEVTEKGKELIKEIPPVEEEFVIRYVYAAREGQEPIIPTTRDFCRDMIAMSATVDEATDRDVSQDRSDSLTWSLTDIEKIGVAEDRNVWQRGGGWWGKSFHCRHEWVQVLMKRKKK